MKAILREAWSLHDAKLAKTRLERLASSLHADHPGAAASVLEGLEKILTLQGRGIEGTLYRRLRRTNAIENLNSEAELVVSGARILITRSGQLFTGNVGKATYS